MNQTLDVIAMGACYIDTNVDNFPFSKGSLMGEEIIGEHYEVAPGGSAVNFCRLGCGLGLRTAFIGMAGRDTNGDTLERLLAEQGIRAALVRRPDLLTNIGFNLTNPQGEHIMFVAGTANAALDPASSLPVLKELLPDASMLYLGGCLKLKAFAHAFEVIVQLAKQTATTLVVDHGRIPEGVDNDMLEAVRNLVLGSSYYFPSREEFCALWGVPDVEKGLKKCQELAPHLIVVVKDGANGAFYGEADSIHHIEAEKVDNVVNATGAGDSFNAGVMTAIRKDRSLPDAIVYGCKVAAAKIRAENLPTLA